MGINRALAEDDFMSCEEAKCLKADNSSGDSSSSRAVVSPKHSISCRYYRPGNANSSEVLRSSEMADSSGTTNQPSTYTTMGPNTAAQEQPRPDFSGGNSSELSGGNQAGLFIPDYISTKRTFTSRDPQESESAKSWVPGDDGAVQNTASQQENIPTRSSSTKNIGSAQFSTCAKSSGANIAQRPGRAQSASGVLHTTAFNPLSLAGGSSVGMTVTSSGIARGQLLHPHNILEPPAHDRNAEPPGRLTPQNTVSSVTLATAGTSYPSATGQPSNIGAHGMPAEASGALNPQHTHGSDQITRAAASSQDGSAVTYPSHPQSFPDFDGDRQGPPGSWMGPCPAMTPIMANNGITYVLIETIGGVLHTPGARRPVALLVPLSDLPDFQLRCRIDVHTYLGHHRTVDTGEIIMGTASQVTRAPVNLDWTPHGTIPLRTYTTSRQGFRALLNTLTRSNGGGSRPALQADTFLSPGASAHRSAAYTVYDIGLNIGGLLRRSQPYGSGQRDGVRGHTHTEGIVENATNGNIQANNNGGNDHVHGNGITPNSPVPSNTTAKASNASQANTGSKIKNNRCVNNAQSGCKPEGNCCAGGCQNCTCRNNENESGGNDSPDIGTGDKITEQCRCDPNRTENVGCVWNCQGKCSTRPSKCCNRKLAREQKDQEDRKFASRLRRRISCFIPNIRKGSSDDKDCNGGGQDSLQSVQQNQQGGQVNQINQESDQQNAQGSLNAQSTQTTQAIPNVENSGDDERPDVAVGEVLHHTLYS